jgi:hypothetical protein
MIIQCRAIWSRTELLFVYQKIDQTVPVWLYICHMEDIVNLFQRIDLFSKIVVELIRFPRCRFWCTKY